MKKSSSVSSGALILAGVIACFILSGFAALLYQTAWMRQFSLVFGTSELAIAAVLSAYMGGLALGAAIAARFVHRIRRPVLFYGVLEAGIAISALLVPWLLTLASLLYVAVFGGQAAPVDASGLGQSFFYLIIAFLVLLIPTSFMGATLPLLTKYAVQTKEQIGSRVGLLYAMNTAGAIGGTLTAAFILLPRFGLNGTVWFGVVINLIVFLIAAFIAQSIGTLANAADLEGLSKDETPVVKDSSEETPTTSSSFSIRNWLFTKRGLILPIILISGANAFIYEVLFTRLLGHILGGTITAFATMLAGFLSGIAIGSAIASRFSKTRSQAALLFVCIQLCIAIAALLTYNFLPLAIPETSGLKGNVVLAIIVLLPTTLFIGATFPLAVRILAKDENDAAASSARIYSWNTVGAIFGATVAAFFIIPMLKYEGAMKFAVLVNTALAIMAVGLMAHRKKEAAGFAGVFLVGLFFLYQPKMPEAILRASPFNSVQDGKITFYEVGRSATVLMVENGGLMNIRTNGLPEASATLKGAPPIHHNQFMLSTLPVIARPDAEDMLIIGFGGGNAIEGIPSSIKTVDVIEIEQQVIKANQSISEQRKKDPLSDPRLNIIINDARSALALTSKRYDAIVSQPSHPWTAGASHLYTREFMALAKDHLTEDGVYLQWMNTQFVDEFLLKSLSATMADVFPNVRVYEWQKEVIFFLGSNTPLDVEASLAATGRPFSDNEFEYLEKGLGSLEDVIAALVMDDGNLRTYAIGGKVITDNHNYMATGSALAMEQKKSLRGNAVFNSLKDYDPILQPESPIRIELPVALNHPYISRRLVAKKMTNKGVALSTSLVDSGDPQALVMIGLGQETQGDRSESQKNLLLALKANPEDQQARYALISPWVTQLLTKQAVPSYVLEQIKLLEGTGAATLQAISAAKSNDMDSLVKLDSVLARAHPTDLWYGRSVKLRAEWRLRVTTPEFQPRLYNEATQLIDSAIAFEQDQEFLSLRLRSTFLAGDIVSAFETAQRRIYIFETQMNKTKDPENSMTDAMQKSQLRQVNEVKTFLKNIENDTRISEYRYALLNESIERLTQHLKG